MGKTRFRMLWKRCGLSVGVDSPQSSLGKTYPFVFLPFGCTGVTRETARLSGAPIIAWLINAVPNKVQDLINNHKIRLESFVFFCRRTTLASLTLENVILVGAPEEMFYANFLTYADESEQTNCTTFITSLLPTNDENMSDFEVSTLATYSPIFTDSRS